MAFQVPITVKEAISKIHSKTYLLPAIQREVVWDKEQIERLFDSLMRDYPIGSFLFWMVKRKQTGRYQFYEFVRDYHERDHRHNPKANVTGEEDITGVLDGQQRLTALYVGLRGSFTTKEPRKRWDNPEAFPKRHLYLNLKQRSKDESRDLLFDFRFLTSKEIDKDDEASFWYRVGDILDLKSEFEVNNYLIEKGLMADPRNGKFANETLFKLWTVVHKAPLINYFLEEDEQLDKVLNIFIRVNSGGPILSYSDLLLSIATAQWTKLDARETITAFVDELNGIGNGFAFNKDWVLKSCLVLGDFTDIAFKVDNFNKANMLRIENSWGEISEALQNAVILVSSFGYGRETLTSNNAVIPIAYHLLQRQLPGNFDQAAKYSGDRERIRHWLMTSLLKRVFGGQPDNVLRPIRDVLKGEPSNFPLGAIRNKFKRTTNSLSFTKEDIDSLLEIRYGQSYAFSVLALLYPTLDFRNTFHMDHIHPRSRLTKARLSMLGISGDVVSFCIDNVDLLPNLQLIEGIPNQEKNDADFSDWLNRAFKGKAREAYLERNYIPDSVGLGLGDFQEFFNERKQLQFNALSQLLKAEEE
jgi:hypothetical protein